MFKLTIMLSVYDLNIVIFIVTIIRIYTVPIQSPLLSKSFPENDLFKVIRQMTELIFTTYPLLLYMNS